MKKDFKLVFKNFDLFNNIIDFSTQGIYSVISFVLGIIFLFSAISQYPGYSISLQFVSELGTGPGLSAPLFNIGLLLIGVNSLNILFNLIKSLKKEFSNIHFIRFNIVFLILGTISLALVGCFPQITYLMAIIHFVVACSFFVNFPILLIGLSILMLKSKHFYKFQAIAGFFVGIPFITFLITELPLVEWISVFTLISWGIIVLTPYLYNRIISFFSLTFL
ncbi:MAG: DUF998 domain-containing protein [Candidatus Lokiarchaeota archaeon]